MKALFSSPTYGPVAPECVSAIQSAVMTAGNGIVSWAGVNNPDRMSFMDARNNTAETLAADPSFADGIMWVDSDMVPDPSSIGRLLHTVKTQNLDFMSGIYFNRSGLHRPVFYSYDPEKDIFQQNQTYEQNVIIRAGGCGFGFCWTSTRLIMAIQALPTFSTDRGGWFPDHHWGKVSEDLGFCRLAYQTGTPLYINCFIEVGHLGGSEVITREHYLRVLAGEKGLTRVSLG